LSVQIADMQNPFKRNRLLSAALVALAGACAAPGSADDATTESSAAPEAQGDVGGAGGSAATTAPTDAPSAEREEPTVAAVSDMTASTAGSLFHAPQPWTKNVYGMPKNAESDDIIGWLADHGGWGTPKLRIEFSIKVLHVTGDTPFYNFTPTDDFYSPDCDKVPFPVPAGGALEDEQGYECTTDGDCHLLVVHHPTNKLYEMWRANISGGKFYGGCATVWDLNKSYPRGRGDQCTSADAGGFPISAMVFTADEVAKGSIDHAIRFILPNSRIRRGVYVRPATHASDVLTGGANAPPYGVRLRLRRDFPLEQLPTEGARVVARALQRYGMILADGGKVPLTAADDRFTEHKWDEVGVEPGSLGGIGVRDMEVVDMGEPIKATGDCERN
jgi:serine/threonine-protein kinase